MTMLLIRMMMVLLFEIVTMTEMVLLMVGLSGWGFLSSAGLLLCRGQGPDIATRYVGRPVNTHLQKTADGHFQNYYDDRVSSWTYRI